LWREGNTLRDADYTGIRRMSINFEKKKGRQGSLLALSFGTAIGCKAGARTTAAPYATG